MTNDNEFNYVNTGFYSPIACNILEKFVADIKLWTESRRETVVSLAIRTMKLVKDYDNQIVFAIKRPYDTYKRTYDIGKFHIRIGLLFKRWANLLISDGYQVSGWKRHDKRIVEVAGERVTVETLYCMFDKMLGHRYEQMYDYEVVQAIVGIPEDLVITEMRRTTAEQIKDLEKEFKLKCSEAEEEYDRARFEAYDILCKTKLSLRDEYDQKIANLNTELASFGKNDASGS